MDVPFSWETTPKPSLFTWIALSAKRFNAAVNGEQAERPMTHNLMITLLDGLGAEVERVVINDVKEGTFFARLIVSMENELGHKIVEVDARPSDSIVLALTCDKPLYVAQKVLDSVDDMAEILAKILKEGE